MLKNSKYARMHTHTYISKHKQAINITLSLFLSLSLSLFFFLPFSFSLLECGKKNDILQTHRMSDRFTDYRLLDAAILFTVEL